MKTKATKKFLSLVLAVIMIMGSAVAMFAYAEAGSEPAPSTNAPKDYAAAADKELLWNVDFASEYYTAHDDQTELLSTGGQTYAWKDGAAIEYNDFRSGWRKSLVADPTSKVVKDGGNTLEISGPRSTGVEDDPATTDVDESTNLDAQSVSTTAATDHRYIGEINAYEVAGKSFTIELQAYKSKNNSRTRVYFGNGSFMNFGGCDTMMPVLGLEPQAASYVVRRQSADCGRGAGKPTWTLNEAETENYLNFKIVYNFGTVIEDVTLWNGTWLQAPASDPTADSNYYKWTGDAIPVEFAVYNVITESDGSTKDIRVLKGEMYQPAARDGIVLGIGNWDGQTKDKYYGIRNVKLYKGDTSIPFTFGFEKVYNDANWGTPLTTFDAKGITDAAFNYTNGYEWGLNEKGVTVDNDGAIFINSATAGKLGAFTPSPLQEEWNMGYWEMELTINNANRMKVGLINIETLERAGFALIPNMKYTAATPEVPAVPATPEVPDDPATEENEYQAANPGSPAVPAQPEKIEWSDTAYIDTGRTGIYFGSGNGFSLSNAYVKTTIYDTYVADDKTPNPDYDADVEGSQQFIVDEDTLPDDPRLVRDQGGNRANVKITFNCEDSVITLYEKVNNEWVRISSIDYSAAVEAGVRVDPVIDFYAYDANCNITIKNVRVVKGMSAVKMYTYTIAGMTSPIQTNGADAEMAEMATEYYVDNYNLGGAEIKWSIDGGKTALESFDEIYGKLNTSSLAPENVNLIPLITYEEMAKAVALRGVKFSAVSEEGKYNVNFVAALDDVDLATYKAVGFKVTKVTTNGEVVTATALENVETSDVFEKLYSNGAAIEASAFGGKYVVSAGINDEVAAEGVQVDYVVSAYVVAVDGTVVEADEAMTFTFIGGEYTPKAPALVIPQA